MGLLHGAGGGPKVVLIGTIQAVGSHKFLPDLGQDIGPRLKAGGPSLNSVTPIPPFGASRQG